MVRRLVFWLAIALSGSTYTALAQGTAAPGPTQPGTAANCNNWHMVKAGDGCDTIEKANGITHAQFLAWNPAVSQDCQVNFWGGYAYCVGVAAGATTTPRPTSTTTKVPSPPTSPPGPTFTSTPANCNAWHLVKAGDDCGTVAKLYGITVDQFLKYNPDVSKDCTTNFWLGNAYCVGLGPAISTTAVSTSPRTSTTATLTSSTSFNSTYSIEHPLTSWIISTSTIDNSTWPPTKTQAGQPSYCSEWHLVSPRDDCQTIAYRFKTWMTLADFFAWNPAVGTDCSGLYVNYYVCVGIQPRSILTVELPVASNLTLPPIATWTEPALPTLDPNFTPTPSHGPMPTNCANFYLARAGDTCDSIVSEIGGSSGSSVITRDQFLAWNPVLAGNCAGLWAGYYYCAGAYSPDALPPLPTVTTKPSPLPPGSAPQCVAWYKATVGDTCGDLALVFGTFSESDFRTWNPSVKGDCSGFEVGAWYCVAVPGTPTTRTTPVPTTLFPSETSTSSSASSTSRPPSSSNSVTTTTRFSSFSATMSEAAITTPQPIQPPMVKGCRRFYFVKPGDGCWQIATDAGISLDNFYSWNPAARPDCSSLWFNVYVCVGV
ncbi:peptidoglycan-binding protein [Coniochaeta sp. 2T2.1]|nr:peptidoglycan-binding protein [Coniochaeta sp. 2T2.1]